MESLKKEKIEIIDKKIEFLDKNVKAYQDLILEQNRIKKDLKIKENVIIGLLNQKLFHESARIVIGETRNTPSYQNLSIFIIDNYLNESIKCDFYKDIEENGIEIDKEKFKSIVEKILESWEVSHAKIQTKKLKVDKKK